MTRISSALVGLLEWGQTRGNNSQPGAKVDSGKLNAQMAGEKSESPYTG